MQLEEIRNPVKGCVTQYYENFVKSTWRKTKTKFINSKLIFFLNQTNERETT